jgi:hypothetical protein
MEPPGAEATMSDTFALDQGSAPAAPSPVDTALKAAQAGASDAVEAARRFLPVARQFVDRAGYNSAYALSYGVVFPAVFLARIFPAENPVAYGLADGARAGLDLARKSRESSTAGSDSSGDGTADPLASAPA